MVYIAKMRKWVFREINYIPVSELLRAGLRSKDFLSNVIILNQGSNNDLFSKILTYSTLFQTTYFFIIE